MTLRHAFRGSKVNRDRRDDAFAKAVIGLAEANRRELLPKSHARVIVAGQEFWHHDVIGVRSDGRYLMLDLAAHPHRVNYWMDNRTEALLMADDEKVTQSLREEMQETLDGAVCDHCGKLTCLGDCPQYYEAMQDQMEVQDDDGK